MSQYERASEFDVLRSDAGVAPALHGQAAFFGTEANNWRVRACIRLATGHRVWWAADGKRRSKVRLTGQRFAVDAFDIAPASVARGRRLAAAHGALGNYPLMDGHTGAWPEALYDGVLAIFEQFANRAMQGRGLANMAATRKAGGTLVLQGHTPKQLEYRTQGPPMQLHRYAKAQLRLALRASQIIELREYVSETAEEIGHRGPSAFIGIVGQRQ